VTTTTAVRPVRVDAAFRALRVPFRTKLKLRWYARTDRRAGLPIGLSPGTTPVLQQLLAQFGDVAERQRASFFAAVEPTALRLAALAREIELLREELIRRTHEADQLATPPGEEWLGIRYPGEERLDESAVRGRRSIRHWHAAEAARTAQRETQERLDAALVEQAERRRAVRARAEHAVARVVRYARLTEAEAAIYRRWLVRRHPQRDALVDRWTTDICPLPGWASADALCAAVDASGESA
jgi:hypothetical protein